MAPGAPPKGGGKIFFLKFSSNTMRDILCKFGEDRAKNEEQFWTLSHYAHCVCKEQEEEEQRKRIRNPACAG